MPARVQPEIDWRNWLRRWDRQQAGYVPQREQRFSVMFDALATLLPESFVALDLACGPGSLSQRLLARFPAAHAVAVDMDPVMLALGRGALGTVDGRLRWIEADLSAAGWAAHLGEPRFDAVLSSTALHWLAPTELLPLYRELGQRVRPGGVVINADHMAFGPELPTFQRLASDAEARAWSEEAFAARGIETAEQWWEALAREPALAHLLDQRQRLLASKTRPPARAGYELHVAALRDAGFREVGTIWQSLSDHVLLAVR